MSRRPPAGQVLTGFDRTELIARGAFAAVYRAVEAGTGRPVALKVLETGGISPHLIESFTTEARALALVSNHPHIVTLYRTARAPDGRPVLVLELCRSSYAVRLAQHGRLPADEVVSVGIKIAGALQTAHQAGYLHRDVKPSNILLTEYGEPALSDFGVASLHAAAVANHDVTPFTTLHAPPEVLEGAPLSAATDVYELASTLYQLLTGKGPFAAFDGEPPASLILRILRDPVAPALGPDIPLPLSDLLVAALAKDPRQRPASATEMAEALRRIQARAGAYLPASAPWGAEPPTTPEPTAPAPLPPPPSAPPPAATGPDAPAAGAPPPDATGPRPSGPSVVAPAPAARRVLTPNQGGTPAYPQPTRLSTGVRPPAPGGNQDPGPSLPPPPAPPAPPPAPPATAGPAGPVGPARPAVADMPLPDLLGRPAGAPPAPPAPHGPEGSEGQGAPPTEPAPPVHPAGPAWSAPVASDWSASPEPYVETDPLARTADPVLAPRHDQPADTPAPPPESLLARHAGLAIAVLSAATVAIVVAALILAGIL